MFFRCKLKYLFVFVLLVFVCVVIYLNKIINDNQSTSIVVRTVEEEIYLELSRLPEKYKLRTAFRDEVIDSFLKNAKQVTSEKNLTLLWGEAKSWIDSSKFVDIHSSHLGNILTALKTAKIIHSDVDSRGTQLKLLVTLDGNQLAVFKPKWYEISKVIDEGPVYAGKDKYGSEILGFYLSIILNKPWAPLAVERTVSLKHDIMPVASSRLKTTSFIRNNITTCVYGTCSYCKKEDPICDDSNGSLTGAVIFNVDAKFQSYRSPWQRTYKANKKAAWENSKNYCSLIKLSRRRLYDLIDIAVFDFLIQNGDRHHYETFEDTVVYIDNGKGLRNPRRMFLDILAPLYQCCMLRKSTWNRLQLLSGGFLREKLEEMPDIKNFVTDDDLTAVEERLALVFATVEYCHKRHLKKAT